MRTKFPIKKKSTPAIVIHAISPVAVTRVVDGIERICRRAQSDAVKIEAIRALTRCVDPQSVMISENYFDCK